VGCGVSGRPPGPFWVWLSRFLELELALQLGARARMGRPQFGAEGRPGAGCAPAKLGRSCSSCPPSSFSTPPAGHQAFSPSSSSPVAARFGLVVVELAAAELAAACCQAAAVHRAAALQQFAIEGDGAQRPSSRQALAGLQRPGVSREDGSGRLSGVDGSKRISSSGGHQSRTPTSGCAARPALRPFQRAAFAAAGCRCRGSC